MKILVTGGTGVIGIGAIPHLLHQGHTVRLLSRHAAEDANQWEGVEPFEGNVADLSSLEGVAEGCDAVLHIAGVVAEQPPDITFQKVNVGGTANILAEAKKRGVSRFVFVSSLGADRGVSDYHQSKRAAENLIRASDRNWTIVRPGNVYGPGDEVISTILKMVRTLPAVPVIDSGDQPFQPIWHEDLAQILAAVVSRDDLAGRTLEAAGKDVTNVNDLLRQFSEITDRKPIRLPLRSAVVQLTASVASTFVELPVDDNKLAMLKEENVVRGENAVEVLEISPTPLEEGLKRLADALPETDPSEGVGSLEHKTFAARIRGSRHSASSLMQLFRDRVSELMPIEFEAEPNVPRRVEKGVTLTGALPLRGNFQVRVEVAEPTHVVFATVEGHPLAGTVEFTTRDDGGALLFQIDTFTRASNFIDWLAMKTVGAPAQNANWRTVVTNVVEASGGTSDGVEEEHERLADEAAEAVERRILGLIQKRKREASKDGSASAESGRV